ncbi:MAG: hypothetical protein F6K23_33415 [Okeania sp. SIO2C9]|uniref:hypothetical protein n=1 Tax=Okeania sp. SIO2C9 TaxID=2607791 RepID=UPI0013C23F5C|nr:hypothetical protein [Okeania sp. SIO2C9]NEQ77480.1 hypothetical protein [Okeania sp. SIO2C9]
MANISISDLRPAGADLFLDSESYLEDIYDDALQNNISGGISTSPWCVAAGIALAVDATMIIGAAVYTTTRD